MTDNAPPPNLGRRPNDALAVANRREIERPNDPEWQRLWLTVEQQPWRSLAIVPAGDGASEEFALTIAVALSRIGLSHLGAPILVADGSRVPLNQLKAFLSDVAECTNGGERVLVALPSLISSPTSVSIAQSTDAAVLCVQMDVMSSSHARQTMKLVGQSHFLGTLIIRSPPPA